MPSGTPRDKARRIRDVVHVPIVRNERNRAEQVYSIGRERLKRLT